MSYYFKTKNYSHYFSPVERLFAKVTLDDIYRDELIEEAKGRGSSEKIGRTTLGATLGGITGSLACLTNSKALTGLGIAGGALAGGLIGHSSGKKAEKRELDKARRDIERYSKLSDEDKKEYRQIRRDREKARMERQSRDTANAALILAATR